MTKLRRRALVPALAGILLFCVLQSSVSCAAPADAASSGVPRLWAHDNLFAWCVVPFDANKRSPIERAQMLQKLGFKSFAYDWRDKDIPTFDEEIETLKAHGIQLLAWWFPLEPDDPKAKAILETFKRHHVHPQLWVTQSLSAFPKTPEDWQKWLPQGMKVPKDENEIAKMPENERNRFQRATQDAWSRMMKADLPKTPQEQQQRVEREAERIRALAQLAAPYGSPVELYNHNGWFGLMDNEVAIIRRLKSLGVRDVGIAYNFSHARDDLHDDSANFPSVWKQIQPYVVAVNVTGIGDKGQDVYPSQGQPELAMMRTIERSGWKGPVGLIAEMGGDAQVTLGNYLQGLDWLAAELKQPGSGGARPFAAAR